MAGLDIGYYSIMRRHSYYMRKGSFLAPKFTKDLQGLILIQSQKPYKYSLGVMIITTREFFTLA